MRKKLIVNFFYQASYQVLLIILPIITIPVVSNALGPAGIGKYNYVNSITSYFVLVAGLGIANYGVREISIVRQNKLRMSQKFWELAFFNLIFSSLTLITYLIFAVFLSDDIFFIVNGITIFSCIFDITWFFSGIEDFRKITIRNFIVKLTGFALILGLIKSRDDLLLYFLITSISTLISQISLWISLKKYIVWVRVNLKDILRHVKAASEFFIAKIAISIYQNTSKTILGLMTTMSIVGIYSNAYSLVLMSGNIINAMNTIMIPRMSNMFSENDEKGMIRLLQKTLHFQMFFTIPISFGIFLTSSKLVPWFFGPEFMDVSSVLKALAPVVVLQSFQMSVASQYLIPKKEMKEYNISIFIGAVLMVISTILTIPIIGIYGAVFGINFGYFSVSLLRLRVLLKETDFKLQVKTIVAYFISALLMVFLTEILTKGMAAIPLTTLTQVFIGSIIYMITTSLFKANPLVILLKKN